MNSALLSPDFLRKLEQLEIVSKKIFAGRMKGDRRSKRKGSSVEFADHKSYVVGDDLRFIDWKILVRLDRLFVKLFEEEEDLHVHFLIDASLSMGFGEPSKLQYAKQVTAALAFIGLVNQDRVTATAFCDSAGESMPAARGRHSLWRVLKYLDSIPAAGASDLTKSCRNFAMKHPSGGVVVLVSDLLDKNGYEAALRYLVAKRMDIYLIHVMAQEEIEPDLAGDLQLVDVEDGDRAEVTISAPLLAKYKANLRAFCDGARDYCARRGIAYVFASNQSPFERLVLTYLRERGLIKQ